MSPLLLVKTVPLPAVAELVNVIGTYCLLEIKVWVTPELLVMPVPLRVNCCEQVMVNGLAPALNTIPLTSIGPESEILVMLDVLKVAVSTGPLGTVLGVQLSGSFQSPLTGLVLQVALTVC